MWSIILTYGGLLLLFLPNGHYAPNFEEVDGAY